MAPGGSRATTSGSDVPIFAAALLLAAGALLAETPAAPKLAPLQFLVGSWEGEPRPGEPSGTSTFAPDLQGSVLVRTNHASSPATGERPASVHDDLMVIYADPSGALWADYWDNEGHVIRYAVSVPAAGSVLFVSEASAATPRFRLSYSSAPEGKVSGRFEIAPPGKPEAFSTYLAWTMSRRPQLPKASPAPAAPRTGPPGA